MEGSSFDTMIQILLDGFVTIQNQEKESVQKDIRTFFPNIPTKTIFNVEDSPFQCKICDKKFKQEKSESAHKKCS